LAQVIRSASAKSPHAVTHWQVGNGKNSQWAVREGDWKLIGNARDTADGRKAENFPLFLANIAENPGETKNYAKERADIAARLQQLHEEWAKKADQAR
jgi:arylsulfatase A-like enzyme